MRVALFFLLCSLAYGQDVVQAPNDVVKSYQPQISGSVATKVAPFGYLIDLSTDPVDGRSLVYSSDSTHFTAGSLVSSGTIGEETDGSGNWDITVTVTQTSTSALKAVLTARGDPGSGSRFYVDGFTTNTFDAHLRGGTANTHINADWIGHE